jgi:hypothetical protein
MSRWTSGEKELLGELAGSLCAREIAERVGHTRFAVLRMMHVLGLGGMPAGRQRQIAAVQLDAIRNVRPGTSFGALARQLGLSGECVRHWARKMGVRFETGRLYSEADCALLRELAGKVTAKEAAARLGRTCAQIWEKARRMRIAFLDSSAWTEEESERLRGLAGRVTAARAAELLGRTAFAVRGKALRMGIPFKREPRPKRESVERRLVKREIARQAAPSATAACRPARVRDRRMEVSRVEWCGECHAPVSNWQQHYERMGHRRRV